MSGLRKVDVKRALRTYVLGHDARIGPAAKEEWARSSLAAADEPTAANEPTAADDPPRPGDSPGDAPDPRGAARFGVPVPERLAFHRSASRWRERIPGLGRLDRGGA